MEPETYLVDNPKNKENFDILKNLFLRDRFVPFIGAGPSTLLGEPGWPELFVTLRSKLGIKVNKPRSCDGTAYPRLFSKLFRKAQDRKKFFSELFNILEPTKTSYTAFHVLLPDIFDAYVTTNYDSPIEKAYKQARKRELNRYYFTCYGLGNLQNCVVYLHGHKDIEFAIIIKEDYDYFYPTVSQLYGIPILEDFLKELYTWKNILFLGFSFDDNYIFSYFKHLSKETPPNNIHFWILDESNRFYSDYSKKAQRFAEQGLVTEAEVVLNSFYNEFLSIFIRPIVYKAEEHIFIERLMEELKVKSTTLSLKTATITGIPES